MYEVIGCICKFYDANVWSAKAQSENWKKKQTNNGRQSMKTPISMKNRSDLTFLVPMVVNYHFTEKVGKIGQVSIESWSKIS